MHSQLTLVLQTLYKWNLEINKMVVEPVETVVKKLGIPYVQSNLNFLADFQVIMHFVAKLDNEQGTYFHNDYLEFREEQLMRFREKFLSCIRKANQKRSPSTSQRLSPHG